MVLVTEEHTAQLVGWLYAVPFGCLSPLKEKRRQQKNAEAHGQGREGQCPETHSRPPQHSSLAYRRRLLCSLIPPSL